MPPLQLDEEGSDKDSDVVSHLTLALPVAGGCRLGVRRDAPAPPWEIRSCGLRLEACWWSCAAEARVIGDTVVGWAENIWVVGLAGSSGFF